MKPLFDLNILSAVPSKSILDFECEFCANTFSVEARFVKYSLKSGRIAHRFCSKICQYSYLYRKVHTNCGQCSKQIIVEAKEAKSSKSGFSFCSRSCATTYNNTHKKHGTRRSKLEVWLETKLTEIYPNLTFLFNNKETIDSELDIFIKELNLAIELNGIFHYEPIYGDEKFTQIKNNDSRKLLACAEKNIELLIIDVSTLSYFKEKNCLKYLDIISNIINAKLERCASRKT